MIVEPAKDNATAVILAGGKSSRMGRPKALLPFDNDPLIVHIVRALKSMFADAVVVAAPEQELPPVPATVVITTPNSEYNPIHGAHAGSFRHPDHRFERPVEGSG